MGFTISRVLDPFNLSGVNDNTDWKNERDYYRNLMQKPNDLNYQSAYNPATMSVAGDFDPRALNQYREQALKTGPSQWANLSNANIDLQTLNNKEQARKMGLGQAAEGASRLAMSGGLSSGARERLQRGAAQSALEQSQNAGREGDLNKLDVGAEDEKNRMSNLGSVVGLQNQALQPREFDINQAVNEGTRKNAFDLTQYQQQMQAWAGNQQAAATAAAGKKGSLFGGGANGGKK